MPSNIVRLCRRLAVVILVLCSTPVLAEAQNASAQWDAKYEQAADLYHRGSYQSAKAAAIDALAMAEQAFGSEDSNVAASLYLLGLVYLSLEDYKEASRQYERGMAITKIKLADDENKELATHLNNLAAMYWGQKKFAKALPLYKRALAIEEATDPESSALAISLNNLAMLYIDRRDFSEALPLLRRSLEITEKKLGPKDPGIAAALHNLAILYWNVRDYEKAEKLLLRAIAILDESLEPNHPDVLNSLDALSVLYRQQNKVILAVPLEERSAKIKAIKR